MKLSSIEQLINNSVSRAISDYKMISNRDKILIGVSGIDSLALLDILSFKQSYAPVKFKLAAVHLSLNEENAKIIETYLKTRNIEYYLAKLDLEKNRKDIKKNKCFWCSWKRRTAIFKLAERLKCGKVAFGHHLDDMIETLFLNMFFHGEISAIPPKVKMLKGNFSIIRPLCYLEKKDIKIYAQKKSLPEMAFKCPYSEKSSRILIRKMIEHLEQKYPRIKRNILKSMTNINKNYLFNRVGNVGFFSNEVRLT